MDKSKKLIIVIILLVVIIGGVSFYAFHQAKENKEMSELFAVEKLEMENEYTTFATQYDELQIQINNDSLREKLESEKLKTQRLLEELRQVKTSNAAEIMRLKKELKTVRAVLRTYVIQIDSLNKLNQALAEENQEVKQKYTQATRQINNLSQEKKNLNEKVTLAAQLDATAISVEPRNKRGKTAKKVKDVKKIAISFTIVKNITANEPFFQGHFPQEPVMPGVLQVEAMAQVGGLLVLNSVDEPERYSTYFMKIDGVKFRQKVVPGDTLLFRVELLAPIRRGISTMKGYAFVGEKVVCEAEFMAQIVKNK